MPRYRIWDFHGDEDWFCHLLTYDTILWSDKWIPKFWRNKLPSGLKLNFTHKNGGSMYPWTVVSPYTVSKPRRQCISIHYRVNPSRKNVPVKNYVNGFTLWRGTRHFSVNMEQQICPYRHTYILFWILLYWLIIQSTPWSWVLLVKPASLIR
jgi:hypothetical protein